MLVVNTDYRPGTGRFTSEDSVEKVTRKLPNGQEVTDPLSLNKYTYCYNNPVRFTDPSGNVPFMLLTGAAGALAGAITAGIKSAMSGKFSWKDVGEGALIGGAIGLTGGAAVSLLATGSAFAATGTVMGALGFGASATTVGSLGVAEFGQAQLLLERSVSTAGEQLVNTVAPQATQAMQSAQQIFQNGSLYESIITLNDGRIVDVVGEVIIEDKYLFINHMMMYAREGDIPNEVGPALLKQSLNALQYLAYQQGFEKLRVYGERVLNSSSVNPGMTLDHIFNLIKKFGG